MKKILPISIIVAFATILPVVLAEYSPNTEINFVMILTDPKSITIPNATCTGYIWNKDMATLNQTLSLSYSSQSEVYYANFTTPSEEGQYLQTAQCNLTNGKIAYDRKTFVVSATAGLEEKLISINNTIKSVNNTVMTKLYRIQDEISSVNNTVLSSASNTNNLIISLNNTVNYWGSSIEAKLDAIVIGNVTVTANVDYDEIAIAVMQYYKAFKNKGII